MTITKKPTLPEADDFIQGAKAEKTALTEKRKSVKTATRETALPKKKMTVYLTEAQYLKWKSYELKQLQAGKRVSFQGEVEGFLNSLK